MRALVPGGVLAVLLLMTGCTGNGEVTGSTQQMPSKSAPSPSPSSTSTQQMPSKSTLSPSPSSASPLTVESAPGVSPSSQSATSLAPGELTALNQNLIGAAWDNNVAEALRLIAAGADVNYEDETEQSAFLIAASEGYLELLDLTLGNGADVHARDSYNGTALIRAAERGHADVVRRLLETDVNVNHVNNPGWTALHEAIIFGDGSPRYVETVQLLVEGGADVRLPSQGDGVTPLQHATSLGFQEIAVILREAMEQ
ncbi:ankyrin repeat domain-containing protein [Arthrobacter sp. H41]|uniref:ankyrin repeat domain-containing protein n=1 Tax=Arthrobacter sp. H41 TaxID=1312978 RepID=UPI0004B38198|nr:ankyrin repeat domain-containing protein [Arthrobacter sp. H41]